MTKSGRKQTNSDYAELRLGIDLGYAKSISICGLGIVVLLCVVVGWRRLKVSLN